MTIEKPISTIRKAVNSAAQNMAESEFIERPEQRHYEDVFSEYKLMRAFEPELLEKLLLIGAKGSDLREEMGEQLYKVFNRVKEEVTSGGNEKLKDALEQMKRTKILSLDELDREIVDLNSRYLKAKGDEIKNDPRIIASFSGKEELLDKAISFTITSLIDIYRISIKTPNVAVIDSAQEIVEKLRRIQRGKPTAKERKAMNDKKIE